MQAHIKYKTRYHKKANTWKFKRADYVYGLQAKADHQGSKISLTEFRWNRPYLIEKVLSNNKNFVCKIGPIKRKCFVACNYGNSNPGNQNLMYISRHKIKNPNSTWVFNTMICVPEHVNGKLKSQFLISITIRWWHPINTKLPYNVIQLLTKPLPRQELHGEIPQKFFLQRMEYVTQQIRIFPWNQMEKWVTNKPVLSLPAPALCNTVYVKIRSLTMMTITEIKTLELP